jgi:D-inositol-3-phosphate glycosyltransferase
MVKGRAVETKRKLLWVGDAVAHTGFSAVTHGVLNNLHKTWDVTVLGINYYGDPHDYPYPIYPASLGGDLWGVRRVQALVQKVQPDVVLTLNDPWIVKDYIPALKGMATKKVAYMPIDAKNIKPDFLNPLNELDLAIAYTEFGREELTAGGLTIPIEVIPHGFEPDIFRPIPKNEARKALGISEDWFIVGMVARNQPRKRHDLLIQYFAEWAKDKPEHVRLYLHCALHDMGWDILQLAQHYGIEERLIITSPNLSAVAGVRREQLPFIYSSFDVHAMTTMGEGWGLPVLESMACGVPQIVPEWSALAEWPKGGVHYVPCTSVFANTGGLNTVGGIADKQLYIEAFERMYTDHTYRQEMADNALAKARSPEFSWPNVSLRFHTVLKSLVE